MIYSEDITQQGEKCEITIKGETIACVVICAFERTRKDKVVIKKYRLESKGENIYENVLPSDIIFKK
jgi:hypothetical protein|tara:strand:+ start:195 stop:395 length:201 start_codon:yes stop_codon:yes gene_type:complete